MLPCMVFYRNFAKNLKNRKGEKMRKFIHILPKRSTALPSIWTRNFEILISRILKIFFVFFYQKNNRLPFVAATLRL